MFVAKNADAVADLVAKETNYEVLLNEEHKMKKPEAQKCPLEQIQEKS